MLDYQRYHNQQINSNETEEKFTHRLKDINRSQNHLVKKTK